MGTSRYCVVNYTNTWMTAFPYFAEDLSHTGPWLHEIKGRHHTVVESSMIFILVDHSPMVEPNGNAIFFSN